MSGPNHAGKSKEPRITPEEAQIDLSKATAKITAVGGGDAYVAALVKGANPDRLSAGSQGEVAPRGFDPYFRSNS